MVYFRVWSLWFRADSIVYYYVVLDCGLVQVNRCTLYSRWTASLGSILKYHMHISDVNAVQNIGKVVTLNYVLILP